MSRGNWKTITKDVNPQSPLLQALRDEALAVIPPEYASIDASGDIVSKSTIKMLPRNRFRGPCRICGKEDKLTKEHIPLGSSGNKGRSKKYRLDDWLKYGFAHDKVKREIEQGGIHGYTLCDKCNSLTGRLYGNEYKNWVKKAENIISEFEPGSVVRFDQLVGPFGQEVSFGSKEEGAVKPGAFVRQVLSYMCSLSGTWNIAERHPEIRRIIIEQSVEKLPQCLDLGMYLYLGPKARIHGPQLKVNVKTKTWMWCQEMAFPPFAFLFVLASNKENAGTGLMIGDFTTLAPDEEKYYSGTIEIGFGWSPYPGDYRSRAAIEAGRDV